MQYVYAAICTLLALFAFFISEASEPDLGDHSDKNPSDTG
jgi:hypothetical protein